MEFRLLGNKASTGCGFGSTLDLAHSGLENGCGFGRYGCRDMVSFSGQGLAGLKDQGKRVHNTCTHLAHLSKPMMYREFGKMFIRR